MEVSAFISEERFKSEVLWAVPQYEYENRLASRNLQLIKQISPLEFARDLADYDTFFKNSKNLGEVSFFSSNSSLGIFKAFGPIGRKRTYKAPSYPKKLPAGILREFGSEPSTVKSGFDPE